MSPDEVVAVSSEVITRSVVIGRTFFWTETFRRLFRDTLLEMKWQQMAIFHAALAYFVGDIPVRKKVSLWIAFQQRTLVQFHDTVGYLMNLLWVTYTVFPEQSAHEYVEQCQTKLLDALEHGNYPLPRIARMMNKTLLSGNDIAFCFDYVPQSEKRFSPEKDMLSFESPTTDRIKLTLPGNMVQLAGSGSFIHINFRNGNFAAGWGGYWMLRSVHSLVVQLVMNCLPRINRHVENLSQEEEWGTGPTVVGAMPATFQATVRRYLKMKHESKVVDLSGVARGAKAGDVVGLYMRRSEMLVWLTYSVVAHGLAFLPLDARFSADVAWFRLSDVGCVLSFFDNVVSFFGG